MGQNELAQQQSLVVGGAADIVDGGGLGRGAAGGGPRGLGIGTLADEQRLGLDQRQRDRGDTASGETGLGDDAVLDPEGGRGVDAGYVEVGPLRDILEFE